MIRLKNDLLGMMLHASLYDRMSKFAKEYTPESMGEQAVCLWLNRLYLGDKDIHILVDLTEDYKIVGHAVVEVQTNLGSRIAYCHQAQGDKNSVVAVHEGMEYLEKLALEVGAAYIVVYMGKHSKALEKKYGYKTIRTVLMKEVV